MNTMDSLLIITGTMGAGKTSALGEASDILGLQGVAHAAIDLDSLGLALLPSAASSDGAMYRNLQSVCENYSSLGVRRLLLARAIEDCAELEICKGIVSASNTVVCRGASGYRQALERDGDREIPRDLCLDANDLAPSAKEGHMRNSNRQIYSGALWDWKEGTRQENPAKTDILGLSTHFLAAQLD